MFDQLKGIQAGREFKPHEESVLEQLLKACIALVNGEGIKFIQEQTVIDARARIQSIVDELDFNYDNEILNQLISAASYKEFKDWASKMAFGTYTGCLATRLYNENPEAIIHIKDQELDCILYGLEKANKVIIENCKGDFIGWHIGSYGGIVNSVIIEGVTGKWTGIYIGSDGGSVKEVTISGVTGEGAGLGIGYDGGSVEKLIVNNSTGFDKSEYDANEIIIDGVRYVRKS